MAEVQLRHRFLLYIYKIKPVSNHLVGNWFLYPIRLFSPLRTSLITQKGCLLLQKDIFQDKRLQTAEHGALGELGICVNHG